MSERALRKDEKRVLTLLGLPTLGLALAITVVSTYLPVLAQDFSSSTTIIGLIIGGEGLMALFLPLLAGSWSDRLDTRIGGRLPFLLAATPPAALALALLGFAGSLGVIAILVAVFFAAYFVAYEPYRALYPDLVGDRAAGRSQGNQAVWRGGGTLIAVVGGGLLFSVGKPLPFVAGGVVLLGTIAVFAWGVVRSGRIQDTGGDRSDLTAREALSRVRELVQERRELRLFLAANALWELALAALKTFVVLYITRGLGHSVATASAVIGGVSVFLLGGAVFSGKLGDRLGASVVMEGALWVFGLGLLIPFLVTNQVVVAVAAPVVGFGGAVLMTLPFALLMPLMPTKAHGAVTGYYSLSRGIGVALGPLLAGVAISVLRGPFASTQGYAAVWGVCSVAVLASIPLLRALRRAARDAELRS